MFSAIPLGTYAASSGWTPATPGGLVASWDANIGVTTSGSNVTQWDDQSGNGHHLVTGSSPTFSSTGWNGNKPGISFNGTQWLKNKDAALGGLINGSGVAFTIVAVLKFTSDTNYQMFWAWDQDGSGTSRGNGGKDTSHHMYASDAISFTANGSHTVDGSNQLVAYIAKTSVTMDTYYDSSGTATIDINGSSYGANETVADRFLVGIHPLGAFLLNGTIAELAVYNISLTPTDIANWMTYASPKWGGL